MIGILLIIDDFAKSNAFPFFVIPAKAGIQEIQIILGSCFRRNDSFFDFSRIHHYFVIGAWDLVLHHFIAYFLYFSIIQGGIL